MRVLVLSSTFPSAAEPARGIFIFQRIRRLAERCEVVVVSPVPWVPFNRRIRGRRADVPFKETMGGLTVYRPRFLSLPKYGKSLDALSYCVGLAPFAAWLRRRFPFDVVDAHFEYPDAVGGTLLAKLFRRPVVVTLRGKLVRLSTYPAHRPQLRWMLRHADRVTAVSAYLQGIATTLGVPAERVRVIRNGVDTELFAPMDRAEARRACGIAEGRNVLLTVGGLEAHKGQAMVLETLPALIARRPELLYVMVGAGHPGDPHPQELERAVARLGLADHVRFAGPRQHHDLRPFFCAADLFVLLTKSEGWPNVILESLACGLPVVATRVGGVPEVAREGIDGRLVPYGDLNAFRDAALDALGTRWDRDAIVSYARSLGWNEVIEQVWEEMEAALHGTPTSRDTSTPVASVLSSGRRS